MIRELLIRASAWLILLGALAGVVLLIRAEIRDNRRSRYRFDPWLEDARRAYRRRH